MKATSGAISEVTQPGELLRQTREARGMGLDEVASQLNLTATRVSQLEAGEWSSLPGLTFARGYLRQYARLLELDAEVLVAQFNRATGSQQAAAAPLRAAPREAALRPPFLGLRALSLIVLIVLGIAGFLWWDGQAGAAKEQQSAQGLDFPLEMEGADTLAQEPPAVSEETEPLPLPQESGGADSPQDPPAEEAAADAADGANAEAASSSAVAATPAPAEESPQEPLATAPPPLPLGVLNFDFSEECWLQVKDGEGKVLFSGILKPLDTLELSGRPPLDLLLGNPRAVKLRYNGRPIRITPATARLELP